jgi:hypothetical protein
MKELSHEFDLKIKHFKGDQTKDELNRPCEKCLMRKDDICLVFNLTTGQSRRPCISNYRIDQETLAESMKEKYISDAKSFSDWIGSAPKYMKEDDMKIFIIKDGNEFIRMMDESELQVGDGDGN